MLNNKRKCVIHEIITDTDTDTDLYWSSLNDFFSNNIKVKRNKTRIEEYKTIVTAKYIYKKNKNIEWWN